MRNKIASLAAVVTLGLGAAFALLGTGGPAPPISPRARPRPSRRPPPSPGPASMPASTPAMSGNSSPATVIAAGEGLQATGVQQWAPYPYYLTGSAVMNASGFAGGGHVGWNCPPVAEPLAPRRRSRDGRAGLRRQRRPYLDLRHARRPQSFRRPDRPRHALGRLGAPRIGFLITPALLVYGTGGAAFGAANVNEYAYGSALAASYAPGAGGRIYGGWAYGGGLEWMFAPNWSAKVEYLHADLGTHTASFPGFVYGAVPQFPVPQQFLASVPMRANLVKLGVSFHFNGLLSGNPATDVPGLPSL